MSPFNPGKEDCQSENAGVAEGAAKCTRGPEGDLDIVIAAVPREVRFLLGHLDPNPLCFPLKHVLLSSSCSKERAA